MHIEKAAAKTDTASARAVFAMCANFLLLWVFFRSGAVHGVPFRAIGFIFSEGGGGGAVSYTHLRAHET